MPYCPNCGKETPLEAVYCANCGRPLRAPQTAQYAQPYYSRKEEIIAALLSLLLPGVGQMYVGRIMRGIVIFVTPIVVSIFVVFPILLGSFFASIPTTTTPLQPTPIPQPGFFFVFPIFIIVIGLLWLAFLIWNIFDAYNLARIYNQHLMTTGRPPW